MRSRISTDVDVRPLGTSTSVNVRSVNRPLYNVVDSARSHAADDLSVNHGGDAILVDADIALSPIDIADQPTTFDIVCARARVGCSLRVKFDVAFMHRIVSHHFPLRLYRANTTDDIIVGP